MTPAVTNLFKGSCESRALGATVVVKIAYVEAGGIHLVEVIAEYSVTEVAVKATCEEFWPSAAAPARLAIGE